MMIKNEKEIKNVVIYTRVSSMEQVEGFSLENQEREIKEYCAKEGYNIIGKYTDAGISGKNINKRDSFLSMMEEIKNNNTIDALIVWKLSRLGRNMTDLANVLETLKRNNRDVSEHCILISVKEKVDTKNPMNNAFIYIMGVFAQMERESISVQVSGGMRQRAINGLTNGGPTPLGYDVIDKKLSVNQKEAIIIKKIFYLFCEEKMGYESISRELEKMGARNKKGNKFTKQFIKYTLDNPIYAGYVRWGKKGKTEGETLSRGQHEAIIDEQMWKKTRERRKSTGIKPPRKHNFNFLLTGLISCSECGARMIGYPNGKNKYYACGKWNNNKLECKSNLIRADLIEAEIIQKIESLIIKDKIKLGLKAVYEEGDEKREEYIIDLQLATSNLNKIIKRLQGYEDMRADREITKETFAAKKETLETEINQINANIVDLKNKLQVLQQKEISEEKINFYLDNFIYIFNQSQDNKTKKELLSFLIEKIEVNKNTDITKRTIKSITFNFVLGSDDGSEENSDWVTYDTVPHLQF